MTQEELKEILEYRPDTGEFFWKVKTSLRVEVGKRAGYQRGGYVFIRIKRKLYYAHRLAFLYMTGSWPTHFVDHDNRIRSDNRWSNLKEVSALQNARNASLSKNNTSGTNGVHWDKAKEAWAAVITVERKTKFLGYFDNIPAAASARKIAEQLHGFHPTHGAPT